MFLKIEGSVGDLRGFLEKMKLFQGRDGVPWRKCASVFFRGLRGLAAADPAGPLEFSDLNNCLTSRRGPQGISDLLTFPSLQCARTKDITTKAGNLLKKLKNTWKH